MATVQASSTVGAQPCQTAPDIPDAGKASQSPSFSELQRNSLVSDDTNNQNETLKLLRKQLHSSVSALSSPGGSIGSTTKSLGDELCSTPVVLPAANHPYRTIGQSLNSIASPITQALQASSAPCSPRNGLNVLQSLSSSQLSSPVQRMVSTSAHPSSIISSFTSSASGASGSSVFGPALNASRSLINTHNPPGTPPHFQNVVNHLNLLSPSPLNIAAHAAHVARSSAAESMCSPSSSPRPGILRKRNNDGVSKAAAAAVAAISASSAARLDMSSKPVKATSSISNSTAPASFDAVAPARKKPRKQHHITTEDPLASNVPPAEPPTSLSSSSSPTTVVVPVVSQPAPTPAPAAKASIQQFPFRKRMPCNFGSNYKSSIATGSKATISHFQQSSDVRVKEDKRPTAAELASQRSRSHDLDGWKLYRFERNVDNLVSIEKNNFDVTKSYLTTTKAIKSDDPVVQDELRVITELLEGNLLRIKTLIEHLEESKKYLSLMHGHRPKVTKVLNSLKPRRHAAIAHKFVGSGKRKGQ